MKKVLFFAVMAIFSLGSLVAQEKAKEDIKKGAKAVEEGVKTGAKAVEKEAVKLYNQSKTGGFKVGANIGMPLSTTRDVASFNFGFDATYLFEVANNVEVGGMVGFTSYKGDGHYEEYGDGEDAILVAHKSADFVPIAIAGRYYFNNRKMFAGLDLGYAIKVSGDDAVGGGLYARPKFGFVFAPHWAVIGSFQSKFGESAYNEYGTRDILTVSGFHSANVGIEFSF